MIRKSLLLISLLICFYNSYCQYPHPSFKPYTVEDGLPASEVYQVKQDSKGFIWLATGNGVSRFNGYEFENFSISNGLPDNTVFEIFEDPQKRVWFVPISCKLSYYENGKIVQFAYNDQLQKLLNNPIKTSFSVDEKGNVFLGVFRNGIFEISYDGKITHHFSEEQNEPGLYITEHGQNLIYSTNSLTPSDKIYFNTDLLKGKVSVPYNTSEVGASMRCITTKKGLTLVSGTNQIFVFKTLNDYTIKTFPRRVIWLFEDSDGDLWVGTYLGGVYHVHGNDLDNGSLYLPNLPVNGVIQDKQGGFWFATEGNGIFYASTKQVLVFDESIGLSNNKVNCLATDGSIVYAGTQNGYVHLLSDSIIKTFDVNSKNKLSNSISGMYYDKPKERLLISGKTNGAIISKNKLKLLNDFELFNKIVVLNDGSYWLATAMSLNKMENDVRTYTSVTNTKQLKRINALVKKNANTLLLGAIDGLYEFNTREKIFNYIGQNDTLLSSRILDLAYSDSLLIIATKGKGIFVYDGKRVRQQINSRNGLCGDNVYRLFLDGNDIWAATNKGVNKIILSVKQDTFKISSYTKKEGLASNEINDLIVLNNNVWCATNKGVNVFHAEKHSIPFSRIPLYMTSLTVNDSTVELNDLHEFQHSQNNLKINYIGIGFRDAGHLVYRYRLLGLDTTWNYTQSREIRFTTLPPEKYILQLEVLDENNRTAGYSQLQFTILTPFWQKWWFRILGLLILSGTIFLFVKHRIDVVRKREKKAADLNRTLLSLKLKALRAQMNPHFTFNVMNSIQHFILFKENEAAHRYMSKFAKLIRTILNNSEDNTIPLAEELKALELYIDLEAMRFDNNFKYEITVDKQINTMAVQIPSMLIQPYVENAIKHGILPREENGKLTIRIDQHDSILKCTIEDNGIGREKAGKQRSDSQHRSMGTTITQERLNVINSLNNTNLSEQITDLEDENGNPCGTRVEIFIPINRI